MTMSEEQSAAENSTDLEPPHIFALVVAINKYKSKDPEFPHLTGCKNDGKRFINFLTSVLSVPLSQIVFLTDEGATEAEILRQFDQFFITNKDIQRDDAMIFFFAGHGRRLDAPPGWVAENDRIEALCPHDIQTTDVNGKELWGISDRAINALMSRLAFEKGDNIVAVFDCCFSGGLARTHRTHDGALRARSLPSPPRSPPADFNQEIWISVQEPSARGAQTVISTGFHYKAMASHVLLAACRPDELAMEDPSAKDMPGGLFTIALTECLCRCSLHDTSYAKLVEMLNIKYDQQHPQCEGTSKDRVLFSVNTLRNGETIFRLSEKRGRLYVSAGRIHGVVEGTEFTIETPKQILVLKVNTVHSFEAILERTHHDITGAKVLNWRHPTLKVHSSFPLSSTRVTVVTSDEPVDVVLHQSEPGKWELERCDPLIPVYSGHSIRFSADVEQIGNILDKVANFNSCLYRSDGVAASFSGNVKIRMNRIGPVQGEMNPVGDNLLDVPPKSHSGIDIREVVITDLASQYCFTLENYSNVDLFPYLFYFDPSDYSIMAWYKPASAATAAPLKQIKADDSPSVFGFGYGGFGTDPVEFYLPPGSKTDSVFLKVFLATTYVDMDNVAQLPIEEISGSRGQKNNLEGTWVCETFVLTCKQP